jgi:hypothetical protein
LPVSTELISFDTPCAIALRGLTSIRPGGPLIAVEQARHERRRLVAP